MGNFFHPRTSSNTPIAGSGISEQEKIVSHFAREADLSLSDAMSIVSGEDASVRKDKRDFFENNIEQTYGGMEHFRNVLEESTLEEVCEF